jgi:hypothetical protein
MHQHAGNPDMHPLHRRLRPRCAGEQGDRRHQRDHQPVADEQEGQRLGVGQAVLGADEAGTPQENEEQGVDALHGLAPPIRRAALADIAADPAAVPLPTQLD